MLTMKKVPMLGSTTRNVKRLYETAFPIEQRVPFWSLKLRSNMNGMEIVAYYDEDIFCGFACLLATEDAVYLYYIAVADGQRGKGYGTKILDDLKQRKRQREALGKAGVLPQQRVQALRMRIQRRRPFRNHGFRRETRRAEGICGAYRPTCLRPHPHQCKAHERSEIQIAQVKQLAI